jgi:hypothetical protein
MNEIRLYGYELFSMPEYSSTLPTETTPFKMWRKDNNVVIRLRISNSRCGILDDYDAYLEQKWKLLNKYAGEDWYVGQYYPIDTPRRIGIRWFKVVLKEGPMPSGWQAPDWDNLQRWRKERALHHFPKHIGADGRAYG